MTSAEWFHRAHYIYTHVFNLLIAAGLFYALGRSVGKTEVPREITDWFRRTSEEER